MLIIAGLLLFAVAAVGIWWTVTRTDYLPRLVVWLVKQAIPILFKRNAEKEREKQEAVRNGLDSLREKDR